MFDAYHKWLGIPKDQRPPTHYQLLGIAAGETDTEVIEEAAVRQTAHVRTYQIGPHAVECTRLLNEISHAKLTLLNPAKRRSYDEQLASAAATRITARAPVASAAVVTQAPPPAAFQFDAPEAPIARLPRTNRPLNIAKPPSARSPLLWVGLGVGGAALLILLGVIAVVVAKLGPRDPAPPIIVKKDDGKPPIMIAPKIVEDPDKDKPPFNNNPQPPAPKPNPRVNPVVQNGAVPGARSFQTNERQIQHLAVAPDGSKIAVGFLSPQVYDLQGKHLATFPSQQMKGGIIYTPVAFHPDGQRLLYAYGTEWFGVLADITTRQVLGRYPSPQQHVVSLAISPDGKRALTGHGQFLVYWDLETQQEIKRFDSKRVAEVAFSPDGRRAFTGESGGTVALWDLENLQKLGESRPKAFSGLRTIAMAPDGKSVAVAGPKGLALVELPSLQGRKLDFPEVQAGPENHTAIAFCGDGKMLLTAGKDGLVHLFDLTALRMIAAWQGHAAEVTGIAVDAKQTIAVSGDRSGTVFVWPLPKGPDGIAVAPAPPPMPVPMPVGPNPAVPKEGLTIKDSVAPQDRVAGITQPAKSYGVNLQAGQRYLVEMTGTQPMQPYIFIRNQAGQSFNVHDGTGGPFKPRVSFVALADDVYQLSAASMTGKGGDFTLTIQPLGNLVPLAAPAGLKQIVNGKLGGTYRLLVLPDGKSFISGGLHLDHWDLTGTMRRRYASRPSVNNRLHMALSADDQWVAWGHDKETPVVFEVASGRELPRFAARDGLSLDALAFTPDAKQLVAAFGGNSLVAWDIANQQIVKEGNAPGGRVWSMAVTPDRKRLLFNYLNSRAQMLDPATWQPSAEWAVGAFPHSPTFTPDGRTLALATLTNGIQFFDVDRSQLLAALPHLTRTEDIAFCGNGQLLLASEQSLITVWDVSQRQQLAAWQLPEHIRTFAVDARQSVLVAMTDRGNAYTWPLPTTRADLVAAAPPPAAPGPEAPALPAPAAVAPAAVPNTAPGFRTLVSKYAVPGLAISPDGRTFLSAGNELRHWDLATGQRLKQLASRPQSGERVRVFFLPDGKRAVWGEGNERARLVDVNTGEILDMIGHTVYQTALAIAPDAKKVLAGFNDKTLFLWDLDTKQTRQVGEHADTVLDVTFGPDGKTAYSSGIGNVFRWDLTTLQKTADAPTGPHFPRSLAASPDGRVLALCRNAQPSLLFLDAATLQGKGGWGGIKAHHLAFCADGELLAIVCREPETLRFFDYRELKQLREYPLPERVQGITVDSSRGLMLLSGQDTIYAFPLPKTADELRRPG